MIGTPPLLGLTGRKVQHCSQCYIHQYRGGGSGGWYIRVGQKNESAEFRAGSLSGDARLVTDIKYINKNIYKSIQATQIEFLYFLYIAYTDYYSAMPY